MVFTRKHGDFHGQAVSFREGSILCQLGPDKFDYQPVVEKMKVFRSMANMFDVQKVDD